MRQLRVLAGALEQDRRQVETLTFAPRRAAVIAATPVPHPTSSSIWPVATPAKLTSLAAEGVVNTSIGVNSDQASFWTALKPANGSWSAMELSLRSMSVFMRLTTDAKGSTQAHDGDGFASLAVLLHEIGNDGRGLEAGAGEDRDRGLGRLDATGDG